MKQNNTYFSNLETLGNQAVQLDFNCVQCKNPIKTDEFLIPQPNFATEKSEESRVGNEDCYAVCSNCEKEYQFSIISELGGSFIESNDLPQNYKIDYIYIPEESDEPDNYSREEEYYNLIEEHINDILESDSFCDEIATTNTFDWDIEDWDIKNIKGNNPTEVTVAFTANGEQDYNKMFAGNKVAGTAAFEINGQKVSLTKVTCSVIYPEDNPVNLKKGGADDWQQSILFVDQRNNTSYSPATVLGPNLAIAGPIVTAKEVLLVSQLDQEKRATVQVRDEMSFLIPVDKLFIGPFWEIKKASKGDITICIGRDQNNKLIFYSGTLINVQPHELRFICEAKVLTTREIRGALLLQNGYLIGVGTIAGEKDEEIIARPATLIKNYKHKLNSNKHLPNQNNDVFSHLEDANYEEYKTELKDNTISMLSHEDILKYENIFTEHIYDIQTFPSFQELADELPERYDWDHIASAMTFFSRDGKNIIIEVSFQFQGEHENHGLPNLHKKNLPVAPIIEGHAIALIVGVNITWKAVKVSIQSIPGSAGIGAKITINKNAPLENSKGLKSGKGITNTNRESERPCLNAIEYIDSLTQLFISAEGEFSFALFGKWGRGKTYLMKLLASRLKREHNYEIINFKAWKYRTNPSLWVHLYETFVEGIKSQGFFMSIPIFLRIGIAKYGWWPLVGILFSFILCLIPLTFRIEYVILLKGVIGIGGILYLIKIYRGINKIGPKFKEKYGSVPSFKEKLGLQDTLGNNLKYLIQGWTFQKLWKLPSIIPLIVCNIQIYIIWSFILAKTQNINFDLQYLFIFELNSFVIFTIVLLILVCLEIFCLQFSHKISSKIIDDDNNQKTVLYRFFNFYRHKPKKILLIVDDLDRCEMSEMLSIIESLILLLDDSAIKNNLQIAMLVEEEAIRLAIGKKYIEMIRQRNYEAYIKNKEIHEQIDCNHPSFNVELYSKMGSEVIDENLEKLFLCFLRLEKLSIDERWEAMFSFLKENNNDLKNESTIDPSPEDGGNRTQIITNTHNNVNPKEEVAEMDSGKSKSPIDTSEAKASDSKKEDELKPIKITQDECDEFNRFVKGFETDNIGKWGPRALRALMYKYLFARLLLTHFGEDVDPSKLMDEIKKALDKSNQVNRDMDIYTKIARQVS